MFQILSLGSMTLSLKIMRNIIIMRILMIIFILNLLLNVSNNIECNEIDSNNKSNNYDYNSIDLVDKFFEKHHEVLKVYTVSYSSWSQPPLQPFYFSFFGLRHGTLIILSILI